MSGDLHSVPDGAFDCAGLAKWLGSVRDCFDVATPFCKGSNINHRLGDEAEPPGRGGCRTIIRVGATPSPHHPTAGGGPPDQPYPDSGTSGKLPRCGKRMSG